MRTGWFGSVFDPFGRFLTLFEGGFGHMKLHFLRENRTFHRDPHPPQFPKSAEAPGKPVVFSQRFRTGGQVDAFLPDFQAQ